MLTAHRKARGVQAATGSGGQNISWKLSQKVLVLISFHEISPTKLQDSSRNGSICWEPSLRVSDQQPCAKGPCPLLHKVSQLQKHSLLCLKPPLHRKQPFEEYPKLEAELAKPLHNLVMSMNTHPVRWLELWAFTIISNNYLIHHINWLGGTITWSRCEYEYLNTHISCCCSFTLNHLKSYQIKSYHTCSMFTFLWLLSFLVVKNSPALPSQPLVVGQDHQCEESPRADVRQGVQEPDRCEWGDTLSLSA